MLLIVPDTRLPADQLGLQHQLLRLTPINIPFPNAAEEELGGLFPHAHRLLVHRGKAGRQVFPESLVSEPNNSDFVRDLPIRRPNT